MKLQLFPPSFPLQAFPLEETHQKPEGKRTHCHFLEINQGEPEKKQKVSTTILIISNSIIFSSHLSNKGQAFIPNCLLQISP